MAAEFATISYRSPELFEPEVGSKLDARTDVWALGCLLFAWWFGFSPFECEFIGAGHASHGGGGGGASGRASTEASSVGVDGVAQVRLVACSQLRVLSKYPRPPRPTAEDEVILELVDYVLITKLSERPFVGDVISRVDASIEKHTSKFAGHMV